MSLASIRARQEQMRTLGVLPGARGSTVPTQPSPASHLTIIRKNVWACPLRSGQWKWSVTKDGKVLDSGTESSREVAEQEADEAMKEYSELSPIKSAGAREMPSIKWAYGVTTVPGRRESLLPRTLDSLKRAGFDTPRLFVDGAKDGESWEEEFGLEVTTRYPTIRTFGNWTLSLAELYIRNPECDRYAVFQDDFVTYPNLRAYLDECPYPDKGYWNLYTFPSNQGLCPRDEHDKQVEGWYPSNQMGRGAVALVFDRLTVITLLTHQHMVERPLDSRRGWRAVDGGIVSALKKAGWKEWVHNPSLVQHTGDISSMGNRPHKKAESWRGEGFDAKGINRKMETAAI